MSELCKILCEKFEMNVVKKGEYKGSYSFITPKNERWYLYSESDHYIFVLDNDNDFYSIVDTNDLKKAKQILCEFVNHNGIYKELCYNVKNDIYDIIY